MKKVDQETRKRYWQEFRKACEDSPRAPLTPNKTSKAPNAIDVNLGPNLQTNLPLKLRAQAAFGTRIRGCSNSNIAIRISVDRETWETLKEEWDDIKSKFDDNELKPNPLPSRGEFPDGQRILLYKTDTDATNERDWPQQFEWFILNFWKFAEIFRERFCPDSEPFKRPFEFNEPGDEADGKRFEENAKGLIEVIKKEIDFLDKQINLLKHRKSELQDTLSNYE